MHLGLDYGVGEDGQLTVLASCDGQVVSVLHRGGYGLVVEIDHGEGFLTRYAKLTSAQVELGDQVLPANPSPWSNRRKARRRLTSTLSSEPAARLLTPASIWIDIHSMPLCGAFFHVPPWFFPVQSPAVMVK